MKKLLTIIAAMVLVIGLIAGCGSNSSNGGDGDKNKVLSASPFLP